jgi:hypothetical protein
LTPSATITSPSEYIEPFPADPAYFQGANGKLEDHIQSQVRTDALPVGPWGATLGAPAVLFSYDQNLPIGTLSASNDWNSSANPESQARDFTNDQTNLGISSGTSTTLVPLIHSYTDIGFSPNTYTQDVQYAALGYNHWEAVNAPVIGAKDMLSIDVEQAAFERLMSDSVVSQEPVFGLGTELSNPNASQDTPLNTGISYFSNGGAFKSTGAWSSQHQQTQIGGYQEEAPMIQGVLFPPSQLDPPQHPTVRATAFACAHGNCNQVFTRKSDLARHRSTVHGLNHVKYFCNVPGCSKSQGHGQGYSRDDKLTEHLWKKHGNLGYTKSR